MIFRHDFNSEWWGSPVGIVRDAAFFSLSRQEQMAMLDDYDWVEFRTDRHDVETRWRLGEAGWVFSDVEIPFRIRLTDIQSGPSVRRISVFDGEARPLDLAAEKIADYAVERYRMLPGITPTKLNERYSTWGARLVASSPRTCLTLEFESEAQGYFLAEAGSKGLHLALSGRFGGASVSGALLYHAALLAYAGMGHSLGWASFSAFNTPVLNIYASHGAKFLAPITHFLWFRAGVAGRG